MQYEAVKNLLAEVGYVGTRGINLFRQVAINQARLASTQDPITNEVTGAIITTNTPANASLRSPFQGVSINGFTQNQTTAQSSYNSLQASLIQRYHGIQWLASYTFAKSIDNASGAGGGAGLAGVVNTGAVGDTGGILGNQLDNRANRGVSDFNRTHRMVLSFVWDLPHSRFSKGSTAARVLLSDWQVSGIVTAMSGLPVDVVDTGAASFYGLSQGNSPLARPNFAPGANCETATNNSPPGLFFNPFAFVRPMVPAGQPIPSSGGTATAGAAGTDIGNVGRNCLRGPRQGNTDLGLVKRLPLRESKNIEVRAEFFNLFNQVNLANPLSNFNAVSGTGGSINGATGQVIKPGNFARVISTSNNPRIIQFAVKFNF